MHSRGIALLYITIFPMLDIDMVQVMFSLLCFSGLPPIERMALPMSAIDCEVT